MFLCSGRMGISAILGRERSQTCPRSRLPREMQGTRLKRLLTIFDMIGRVQESMFAHYFHGSYSDLAGGFHEFDLLDIQKTTRGKITDHPMCLHPTPSCIGVTAENVSSVLQTWCLPPRHKSAWRNEGCLRDNSLCNRRFHPLAHEHDALRGDFHFPVLASNRQRSRRRKFR